MQSLRSPAAPSGAPPRPGVQIQQVPFATPSIPRPVSMPVQTPDLHPDLAVAMDLAKKSQSTKDGRDGAYRRFMESLETWGFLAQLPLDAAGVLHVAAPFCHDFFEAPHLLPFLASRFLRPGGARALEVRGCDVREQSFWWGAWEKWAQHTFGGRVRLELKQQDLVLSAQPPSGLILAAHPEVTNGGPWLPILENVLRSRVKGARCVFATFFRQEAEAAAQICRSHGASCEIRENPFYAGRPADEVGTFHRFMVILAPAP